MNLSDIIFKVFYIEDNRLFLVELKFEKDRYIQLMKARDYFRWVDTLDTSLVINGIEIEFQDSKDVEQALIDFFKEVSTYYKEKLRNEID